MLAFFLVFGLAWIRAEIVRIITVSVFSSVCDSVARNGCRPPRISDFDAPFESVGGGRSARDSGVRFLPSRPIASEI